MNDVAGSTSEGALGWQSLGELRVAVWGAGVEGLASVGRLRYLGIKPVVVDREPGTLADGTEVYGIDEDGAKVLRGAEVIIKSPGISRYDEPVPTLSGCGIRIVSGLGLWLADAPRDRVLCVTGTKGKSTTASIAAGLINGLGHRCLLGGNIGVAPWDLAVGPEAGLDYDYWVIEVSSYQAPDLQVGPSVVAVSSLGEDHLNWHHGAENYRRDKLSLCTLPGVDQVLVTDSAATRAHQRLFGPTPTWVGGCAGQWAKDLRLLGEHNLRNAHLAQQSLVALGVPGAEEEAQLSRAAAQYEPLPSRLTLVHTEAGVDFVDDSLSTNVLPTLAAVDAFAGRKVALLVGGFDRGVDYRELGDGLKARVAPLRLFTLPDNGPRIAREVNSAAPSINLTQCSDLSSAVASAAQWAQPDGVVLLSPAAPSFGQFSNYAERSAVFTAAAKALSH